MSELTCEEWQAKKAEQCGVDAMKLFKTGYPDAPGFKERGGTSEASAHTTKGRAETLRKSVKQALARCNGDGLTADECAAQIKETPFSVRPRLTELYKLNEIEKTNQTRRNESGHSARVWRLKPKQRDLFL